MASLVALLVTRTGLANVFYLIGVIGVLAALSSQLIRRREVDCDRASGGIQRRVPFRALFNNPRVRVLLVATSLFQTAYAAAFPFIALRVRMLSGSDTLVAALVFVSQASMAPVSLATGHFLDRWGRKPVFSVAFVSMPLFVLACALSHCAYTLILLQVLGSIGAGVFGVAIVAVSADLTRGTGHFQTLMGASNAALAAGRFARG